ncbi:MAG: hypothetical protein LVT47_04020 [Cyanobacteria bacterium LVE1205-1]|jgi:hypothetical protein
MVRSSPTPVEVYDCQFTQGGLLPHHQPSSLVGVPRSLDGKVYLTATAGDDFLHLGIP